MEWCAAVCVPLLQAATLWQVENRIREVECIIPYACLQLSHTEHMAFPDAECLQNVNKPLRGVCLPLFKVSPLWDSHFRIVKWHCSCPWVLFPPLCWAPNQSLMAGWSVSLRLEKKNQNIRIWVCRYCKFCNRGDFRKTTLKHLFVTCNCCINCFYYLSSSTYYLRRLY